MRRFGSNAPRATRRAVTVIAVTKLILGVDYLKSMSPR